MPSTRIQHRIDSNLKKEAEMILEGQGIKPAQAITIFYTEIKRAQGFPFLPSKVPNAELAKALKDIEKNKGSVRFKNKKDAFDFLDKL
ncbi:MAG: type II toxin-antitoxin system RelB/DinJ family antitoxin [Candidatus Peregrinibacteria bacterium]|nr:type II toxin-antitoxin system RelB/DinJ family antitoxin [Candidatus Peregrinibacteria bacterium]MDZ4245008.1 type II toxin-antitoxin system RelB/DinJ family antitoxin [Candidatus Gracilibacteria bacterium]